MVTVDYPYCSFNVNVIHKCGFMMNYFFYSFLGKYLCSTVIVQLSRIELLLHVCCSQVVILIKADFNLLITGIQACGLRAIVRLLHMVLAAYTWCCLANVNMKHYQSYSYFGLVDPLISYFYSKQLPVSVATTTPIEKTYMWLIFSLCYMETTCQISAWLVLKLVLLAMGVAMIKPQLHVANNIHLVTWNTVNFFFFFFCLVGALISLLFANITSCGCGFNKTIPT